MVPPTPSRPEARSQATFRRIYEVVAGIPRGKVATYGQVARMAGLQGGARTVGWALSALPDDPVVAGRRIPWHRVLGAGGRISPRGGGGDEWQQARRLRREGVAVLDGLRVDLERHRWRGVRRTPAGPLR